MGLARKLIQIGWRAVVPKSARNSLRLWTMLDTPDYAPRLINDFSARQIVVLAPHMDDEVIGPGGTVARHVRSGANVMFIFMTDGMAGDPTANGSVAELRQAESRQAAAILGVKNLEFLGGPDGALSERSRGAPQRGNVSLSVTERLGSLLSQSKPEIIYAPALTDHHSDHWGTNRILRHVIDRYKLDYSTPYGSGPIIRGYEIWTPLPANRMADITEVAEIKRKAIEVFVSQTKFIDYPWTIMGLNQYRSMVHLLGKGYAEAFLESTIDEYRELFDRISLNRPAAEPAKRQEILRPPSSPAGAALSDG